MGLAHSMHDEMTNTQKAVTAKLLVKVPRENICAESKVKVKDSDGVEWIQLHKCCD
jgi:hypothetical protein